MKRVYLSIVAASISLALFATDYNVNSATADTVKITTAGTHHLIGDGSQCKYLIQVAENLGDVTILSSNVKVYPETSKGSGLEIGKGTNVTLKIDGVNHYQGKSGGAGIRVLGTLDLQNNGAATDSLYTQGSDAAGIGGQKSDSVGAIVINSGKVYCYGTGASASLGAATGSASYMSAVTINGGQVTAFNKSKGCAIGCGTENSKGFGTITINGGIVKATTNDPAAIGTNYNIKAGGKIYINGGTIYATSGGFVADIGEAYASSIEEMVVTGGAIYCLTKGTISSKAVDANGNAVKKFTTTLKGITEPTLIQYGSITGTSYSVVLGTDYGIKDAYSQANGTVCFFLPEYPDDAVAVINTKVIDLNSAINITTAGSYTAQGTGAITTNGINIAAGLGDIYLNLENVNINAATVLNIGAGTNVILAINNVELNGAVVCNGELVLNNAALKVVGDLSGTGKLTINGGTHYFKGANTMASVIINGGNIETRNSDDVPTSWNNVKNSAGTDLVLFAANFNNQANKKILNGNVTGTGYTFDLETSYSVVDMYTNATGDVYLYIPSPIPADAVAVFNTLVTIYTQTATEINITAEGAYRIVGEGDGSSAQNRTGYPINVAADIAEDVDITIENVYIKPSGNGNAFNIGKGTNVTLHLMGYNRFDGRSSSAGINVLGNLTIDGEGTLYCKGDYGPGIGAVHDTHMGNITINGGEIIAIAGNTAGGIGCAQSAYMGNITINGGYIEATGAVYGPAIGSGIYAKGANNDTENAIILINGGTIIANQGSGPCAIGRGTSSSNKMNIVIKGGSIFTNDSTMNPAPMNAIEGGDSLFLFQAQEASHPLERVYSGQVGSIQLGIDYGLKDVYTDADGKVYFYLPRQAEGVAVVLSFDSSTDPSTSVDNVENNIHLFALDNAIRIEGAEGMNLTIYNLNGQLVTSQQLGANETVALNSGFYLVKVGNGVAKVVIR